MEVLFTAKRSTEGTADEEDETELLAYCEADVKTMFDISSVSEHVFLPASFRGLH